MNIFTSKGDEVRHTVRRTKKGVVASFRPSEKFFKEGQIGDYVLTFESSKVKSGETMTFKTRLEVSEFPFEEHVKRITSQAPAM